VYKDALILAVFIAMLMLLAWPSVPNSPFGYDEADYMFAAKMGLAANYTDTPTMPIGDFLRIGLSRGRDSGQSSSLSELIRGADDIVFYRHWHGPLYFYWLMPASGLGLDERAMRVSMLAFPICSLFLIYFGCLWIFPGLHGQLAAVLSSALFLWSATTIRSTELAPHQAFVCSYLASLICLAKTVVTGHRRYFYLAVVAAALSCCLLEVGFVTVATLLICGFVERRSLRADWDFAVRSFLLFAATVLVVWPGAILKLSFLKGYLFMAYLAVFRKSPWGSVGLFDTWKGRILTSPVEWLLILVSAVLLLRSRESEGRRPLYPFVAYSILMLAATLRVTSGTARYALPFQPALDVLAGCVLAAYLVKLRPATAHSLVAILSVALLLPPWLDLRRPSRPDPRSSALLSYIRENHLEQSRLLAPQNDIPLLHYYFPRIRLQGYSSSSPDQAAIAGAHVEGVLYPDFPIRYEAAPSAVHP
jgi:hypothetical protein